ncbi:MAG: hypothetical protein J6O71_03410 [Lachnospiraceae bacterium]|nr:hypothetical protein [Lachnospiraceae bacterium]
MNKRKFFISYTALFILFAVFNVGYFALYRTSFLLKDGVITDYYLAAAMGYAYAYVPPVAPDLVYDMMILFFVFLSGLSLVLMLRQFKVKEEFFIPLALVYMFSGFTVIIGYSHPDLILMMLLLPLAVMLFKKKKTIPALIIAALSLPLMINLLRGDALNAVFRWLSGMDAKEICYISMPLLMLAALMVMKEKGLIDGRLFMPLLLFFILYANLITCFFEFSIFEGDGVNSLYVNSGNIYGSLISIADILLRGGSL